MNKIDLEGEKPTRLYLLRHGEVELSRQKRFNGHSDVGLSSEGIRQFEILADRLETEPIRAVYASDLYRSRTGAQIIAKRIGLEVRVRADLREKNFGKWEGMTAHEVSLRFPEEWKAWISDPVDSFPPEGESYRDTFHRVLPVLNEILKDHKEQTVVLVCHGGVNRLFLAHALQLDFVHMHRFEQKYGALNMIDFYSDTAVIKLLNA